ncbi:hypothetical protein D5278_11765 [bacterium 1XD21-13]|nr:hypothetical protein [bacterium 1XD21-13]
MHRNISKTLDMTTGDSAGAAQCPSAHGMQGAPGGFIDGTHHLGCVRGIYGDSLPLFLSKLFQIQRLILTNIPSLSYDYE